MCNCEKVTVGIESLKDELRDLCDRVTSLTSIYWVCQSMSCDIDEIDSNDDLIDSYNELNEELDKVISNFNEICKVKADLEVILNK